MNHSSLDQTLATIACNLSGATRVLDAHQIHACCDGKRTLREVIAQQGIPQAAAILADLNALQRTGNRDQQDWRSADAGELADYLVNHFNERHRQALPALIRLAQRVTDVHATHPACPHGLVALLGDFLRTLETHLQREERIVFPMLRERSVAQVPAPVAMMRHEHAQLGAALQEIARITDDASAPEDACASWRTLYSGLRQLRHDLMEHIHLENNILYTQQEEEQTV